MPNDDYDAIGIPVGITRQMIVEKAREYIGTPFHHQARKKNVSIDCIGLIVGVGKELYGEFHDMTGYTREPTPGILFPELDKAFDQINLPDIQKGDVLCFWMTDERRWAQHVGIVTDRKGKMGLIHTHAGAKRGVKEIYLNRWYQQRILRAYSYRDLEN